MSSASLPLKKSHIPLILKQIQNTSQELNLKVKKETCLNLFPCNKNLPKTKSYQSNVIFGSLGERRIEGRRVKMNDYPPPYLDVFKIKG